MRKKSVILGIIMACMVASLGISQYTRNVSNVGTTAAVFLEIGVGARAVGMGGAFVATANDASAIYWNVAGIARLRQPEILFVHTNWLADIRFDYAGVVIPLSRFGALGASLTSLSMGEMKVRTVEEPEGTGERFSAGDMAIALSYAFNLTNRFSVGVTAKYIYQRIWKETANGFAVDLGTLFTTGLKGLRIGASLSNFGTDMQMSGDDLLVYHDIDPYKLGNNERIFAELKTDKWPLPLIFQVGVAMEPLQTENHRVTMAIDALHPIDNTESINVGVEYAFHEQFFLRAGGRNLFLRDGEEGLTLGAGFHIRFVGNFKVKLDYAYADFGRLNNVQRFSIDVAF